MSKSYWLKDQKGNFSKKGEDTFDPEKRYVGIRLQQGVPLLDRDWNELEDIRRYEEWKLRKWYVGNGTPDDGFKISAVEQSANDFRIAAGRCIVDGFEAVNEPEGYLFSIAVRFEEDLNNGNISKELKYVFKKNDFQLSDTATIRKRKENEWVIADTEKFIVKKEKEELKIYEVAKYVLYSKQKEKDAADLNSPTGREDTVYLDVWVKEVTSMEDSDLKNPDVNNIETCVRHKLEWRVRVKESNEHPEIGFHHYYDLAKITWKDGNIEEVKDLRTIKLTLTSVRNELEEVRRTSASKAELEYVRQATVNRWIKGGEINDKYKIMEMLCIIHGQEIKFGEAESEVKIKKDENCVVLANGLKNEIEFIVTRKNLLEWLNSWTFEKWLPPEDTEPVLKSAFSLPLYFFETLVGGTRFKKTDLRHQGVLDMWLTELAGRLDAPERRMCRVPLLQQTIFDRAVVATVDVGASPRGVAFDGEHIWVANNGSDTVSKINIASNAEVESVDVGLKPHGVAFDGAHIWVSNCEGQSVSRINFIATNDKKTVTMENHYPRGVAFDGTHIWVAFSGTDSGKVCKIDIATMETVESVDVGRKPFGVAFDGAHIWVANNGSNTVNKIDIATNVVEKVTVENSPRGVAFDGAHIWVANYVGDSVSKIDIATNVVETVLKGEKKYPSGIAFDGAHIWVANSGDKSVSKIDIATNTVVATVSVGTSPSGVAFDGTHIWVANNGSTNVSKILRGDLK